MYRYVTAAVVEPIAIGERRCKQCKEEEKEEKDERDDKYDRD